MKEIEKGYMEFWNEKAFVPKSERKNFKELDFETAREIIEKEKDKIDFVVGGLAEDWGYTSATIFKNGKYIAKDKDNWETFYGTSFWATPAIEIYYKDRTTKMIECYKKGTGKNADIPSWWEKENKNEL